MSEATPRGGAPDILVVDDVPANLNLLCGLLKQRGYRTRPAPSGELALQAARCEPPELILLDISMPGLDGFEVCSRLKADPRLREIPVIFLTAHSDTEDKLKAFAAGGVDYVTKPFQFEEIQARVATHLALCRQRRELEGSYRKLREMETLRDNLVHMIVHDLRSPLTALCAFLQALGAETQDVRPGDLQEDAASALSAAKKMVALVSSMLDVSKLEAGRLVPALQECDLGEVALEVVRELRPLAGGRALSVAHGADPVRVLADRELVSRVIQNLLSNALKVTPYYGVIRVSVESNADAARVSVSDTGPGIPVEYRERIFEKFGQVDRGVERLPQSTGLGLTFCKLAVEAHAGRIGVLSQEGQGSTFWFTLPRSVACVAPPALRRGAPGQTPA